MRELARVLRMEKQEPQDLILPDIWLVPRPRYWTLAYWLQEAGLKEVTS